METLDTNVPIKEYIINARNLYNKTLDLSFMDFFMDMYGSKNLVSVELLATYGVLNNRPNRLTLHNNDIKRYLDRCNLKENIDYYLRS